MPLFLGFHTSQVVGNGISAINSMALFTIFLLLFLFAQFSTQKEIPSLKLT